MKKLYLSLLIILSSALILNVNLAVAEAKTSAPVVKTLVKARPAVGAKTVAPKTKAAVVVKPVAAKVAPKAKAPAATSKYNTTMKWDASGLKYLSTSSHFDYSTYIRNAVVKKIENYARRNKIEVVSMAVINSMRE